VRSTTQKQPKERAEGRPRQTRLAAQPRLQQTTQLESGYSPLVCSGPSSALDQRQLCSSARTCTSTCHELFHPDHIDQASTALGHRPKTPAPAASCLTPCSRLRDAGPTHPRTRSRPQAAHGQRRCTHRENPTERAEDGIYCPLIHLELRVRAPGAPSQSDGGPAS
jgi:hypothetical protein